MKTSAVLLALTATAYGVRYPVLDKRGDDASVCRTYLTTYMVPCASSSIEPIVANSTSSAAPSSAAPSSSAPLKPEVTTTPGSSSAPSSVAPPSSSTPVKSSSTPAKSSSTPAKSSSTPAPSSTPAKSSTAASSSVPKSTSTPIKSPSSSKPPVTPTPTATPSKTSSAVSSSKTADLVTVYGFPCGCDWLITGETLYCVNTTTGVHQLVKDNIAGGVGASMNALAFDPQNGLLQTIVTGSSGEKGPVFGSIDINGAYTIYGPAPAAALVGEIDDKPDYWLMDNTTWYQVNWNQYDADGYAKTKNSGSWSSFAYNVYDWAFIPDAGDYLWTVATSKADNSAALARFSRTSHKWEVVKNYGNLIGDDHFGPAWGYIGKTLFTSESKTGNIYSITVPDGTPKMLSVSNVKTQAFFNDGARCWNNSLTDFPIHA